MDPALEIEAIRSEHKKLLDRVEKLEIQHRRAVEASRQKSRFIASLSHELRTPLTSIIGFTEIMLEDTDDPLTPNQKNLLGKVNTNAERLLNMINDLLDLSRMESGRLTVNLGRVDVASLIRQVIDTMQPLVRDRDVRMVDEVGDIPVMLTDEQKLSQVLVNLVANAIKFTPKGTITVRAGRDGEKVVVSVSDTGIGIKRTEFSRIFEEFHQIEGHRVRRDGAGLGLAITRRLVHLLGGEIRVSSKLGEGSTFTVSLPVSLSQALLERRAGSKE